MTAILREDPPDTAGSGRVLPPAVERTVMRCLEKKPAERFQSARDVAFALEAVSSESRPSGAAAAAPRRPARRRVLLGAASVAVIIGAVLVGYLGGRARTSVAGPVSYERLTFREGPINAAGFSPDGKTIVYGAAWEGQPLSIYQTRPEGGELALPLEPADLLSVSDDGQLAVLKIERFGVNSTWNTGALAVVPVLGGAMREIEHGVRHADWAPDSKSIAVVREVGGTARLEYPLGRVIYQRATGYILTPRVSRSGDVVAFWEGDWKSRYSVSTIDVRGHRSVLSSGWADFWGLAWSPDGRELWFSGSRPCEGFGGTLYSVDMTGSQRVLASTPGSLNLLDVAKDGRALVAQGAFSQSTRVWGAPEHSDERGLIGLHYSWPADVSQDGKVVLLNTMSKCAAGSEASFGAYVWHLDRNAPVRVADDAMNGKISPDGRSLLFLDSTRIRVQRVGAGTSRTVELSLPPSTIAVAAAWMPDGEGFVVASAGPTGETTVRRLDGRTGTVLATSAPFSGEPDMAALPVSPDGLSVAAKSVSGSLLVVPLDGRPPQEVPNTDANDVPVQWNQDCRHLFVYRAGEIPSRVFRVEISTGRRAPWKEIRPPDISATGLGSLHLTRDGRIGVYGYEHARATLYLVTGLR
jgi:WD40 repeat protein